MFKIMIKIIFNNRITLTTKVLKTASNDSEINISKFKMDYSNIHKRKENV